MSRSVPPRVARLAVVAACACAVGAVAAGDVSSPGRDDTTTPRPCDGPEPAQPVPRPVPLLVLAGPERGWGGVRPATEAWHETVPDILGRVPLLPDLLPGGISQEPRSPGDLDPADPGAATPSATAPDPSHAPSGRGEPSPDGGRVVGGVSTAPAPGDHAAEPDPGVELNLTEPPAARGPANTGATGPPPVPPSPTGTEAAGSDTESAEYASAAPDQSASDGSAQRPPADPEPPPNQPPDPTPPPATSPRPPAGVATQTPAGPPAEDSSGAAHPPSPEHAHTTAVEPAPSAFRAAGISGTVLLAALAFVVLTLRLAVGWPRLAPTYRGRRRA